MKLSNNLTLFLLSIILILFTGTTKTEQNPKTWVDFYKLYIKIYKKHLLNGTYIATQNSGQKIAELPTNIVQTSSLIATQSITQYTLHCLNIALENIAKKVFQSDEEYKNEKFISFINETEIERQKLEANLLFQQKSIEPLIKIQNDLEQYSKDIEQLNETQKNINANQNEIEKIEKQIEEFELENDKENKKLQYKILSLKNNNNQLFDKYHTTIKQIYNKDNTDLKIEDFYNYMNQKFTYLIQQKNLLEKEMQPSLLRIQEATKRIEKFETKRAKMSHYLTSSKKEQEIVDACTEIYNFSNKKNSQEIIFLNDLSKQEWNRKLELAKKKQNEKNDLYKQNIFLSFGAFIIANIFKNNGTIETLKNIENEDYEKLNLKEINNNDFLLLEEDKNSKDYKNQVNSIKEKLTSYYHNPYNTLISTSLFGYFLWNLYNYDSENRAYNQTTNTLKKELQKRWSIKSSINPFENEVRFDATYRS